MTMPTPTLPVKIAGDIASAFLRQYAEQLVGIVRALADAVDGLGESGA